MYENKGIKQKEKNSTKKNLKNIKTHHNSECARLPRMSYSCDKVMKFMI